MSEIEQLRKDIEQVKEIMLRFYKQDRQALGIGEMYDRLAKLEAEAAAKADPWKEEKESVAKLCEPEIKPFSGLTPEETRRIRASHAARYVRHLEQQVAELETKLETRSGGPGAIATVKDLAAAQARIAELQAELAKRPKVYCVKTHEGIATTGSRSKVPRVFLAESIEDEYIDGAQCVVPYTGEQT